MDQSRRLKRIILVGKGGSGKDYLRKKLENCGFKYCISHTSRPPRDGEVNGEDYYFLPEDYLRKEFNPGDSFYEWVIFNDWFYGTSKEEFYKSNLFIMTPSGVSKLLPEDRKESLIIFLDIDEQNRRSRLLQRRDADQVERRLLADHVDFLDFVDYDEKITDPNFKTDHWWNNLNLYN